MLLQALSLDVLPLGAPTLDALLPPLDAPPNPYVHRPVPGCTSPPLDAPLLHLEILGRVELVLREIVLVLDIVDAAVCDGDAASRLGVVRVGRDLPQRLHDVIALDDLAEDDVFPVEPARLGQQDEELRAVRVGT